MRHQHCDYGDKDWKSKQITWQHPQVWTSQGYRFYMYQSSNGFLNWRCLKAFRPNGEIFNMFYDFKTNISPDAEKAKEIFRKEIEFDLLPKEEKDKITSKFDDRLLF